MISPVSFSSPAVCMLCGSPGRAVYHDLVDYSFGTPGFWGVSQCVDPACGLAWSDPMVMKEHLAELYANYYTHDGYDSKSGKNRRDSRILKLLNAASALLARVSGLAEARERAADCYLEGASIGTLLDVGCGDGTRMLRLQEKGWCVEGQEIDANACKAASKVVGKPIYCGSLEDMVSRRLQFDAVIVHHVLEHVPNPVEFLQQCKELVAREGRLVVVVPNFASRRHDQFGRSWRGLEPPRHLYHFAPDTLGLVAEKAHLAPCEIFTSTANAESFYLASMLVEMGASDLARFRLGRYVRLKALFEQYWCWMTRMVRRSKGDECILVWERVEL